MVRRILREHWVKLLRYAGVSCIGVTTGQALLFVFYEVLEWEAVVANTVAVAIATIPSYVLNRAWVWGKSGNHSVTTEILPFWGMAFLGLILSNVFVYAVEQRWESWVSSTSRTWLRSDSCGSRNTSSWTGSCSDTSRFRSLRRPPSAPRAEP